MENLIGNPSTPFPLRARKILSHEEMKLLTEEEIKDFLSQLKTGWKIVQIGEDPVKSSKAGISALQKLFNWASFVKAMEFVNKIAVVAEEAGHHPDISIHYNKVEIILWSHFVNGLSLNDFIVAAKIDSPSQIKSKGF